MKVLPLLAARAWRRSTSRPEAIADAFNDLGTPVEEVDAARRGARRHRRGPGPRPAAPPRRRPHPARRRRPRRRRGPADLLRRLQHGRGRPRPAGHAGHDDARRHGDRPPQDARRVVQRDALLVDASSASATTTPASRCCRPTSRPGTPAGRGPRHRARRAVGPRGQRQPARRPVRRRSGPRPRRPLRRAASPCRPPRWPTAGRPGRPTPSPSRSSTPTCAAASAPGCCGASTPPPTSPGVDAAAAHPPRHAPDQRPGRHLQLRDARAGPAQPPLRPGRRARRHVPGPPGPAGRDASPPSTTSSAQLLEPTTSSSAAATTSPSASPA